jgi:hypothetical protein
MSDSAKGPKPGYDICYIVDPICAAEDGFPASQIEHPSNRVRIPSLRRWELNAWFDRPDVYGRLSPREYVKGKSWEERWEVGLDGLRAVGALVGWQPISQQ